MTTNPNLDRALAAADAAVGPSALDTLAREVRRLQGEIGALREQLETERMRNVACGVEAMANTPESAKERLPRDHAYWSASYGDVCAAVDREMALRQQLAEREEAAFMAGWIDRDSEVVHGPTWTYSQESQQRDAAFLRWQARQKGTP